MRLSTFAYYFLIVGVLIFMAYGIYFMKSESMQCLKNPYVYQASKMKNVECSCIQSNNKLCPARFSFNDTSINLDKTVCSSGKNITFTELNLSNLRIKK